LLNRLIGGAFNGTKHIALAWRQKQNRFTAAASTAGTARATRPVPGPQDAGTPPATTATDAPNGSAPVFPLRG